VLRYCTQSNESKESLPTSTNSVSVRLFQRDRLTPIIASTSHEFISQDEVSSGICTVAGTVIRSLLEASNGTAQTSTNLDKKPHWAPSFQQSTFDRDQSHRRPRWRKDRQNDRPRLDPFRTDPNTLTPQAHHLKSFLSLGLVVRVSGGSMEQLRAAHNFPSMVQTWRRRASSKERRWNLERNRPIFPKRLCGHAP
jgi:hypothetical protein